MFVRRASQLGLKTACVESRGALGGHVLMSAVFLLKVY